MSAQSDLTGPVAELGFWLALVRTRAAALLHQLADGPVPTPTGRSER